MRVYAKKMGVTLTMMFLVLGLWVTPVRAAEMKFAYVDIQQAVNDCNAGKEAKKMIMGQVEKFQKAVQDRQKDLQAMKESFEKQAPMLTQDARATKEKELRDQDEGFSALGRRQPKRDQPETGGAREKHRCGTFQGDSENRG